MRVAYHNGIVPEREDGFDATSIYNEAYLTKLEKTRRENEALPGEIYRDDETTLLFDLSKGFVRVDAVSRDQLEEDLATMYGEKERGEFILGVEKHRQIFKEACLDIIRYCGEYLDQNQINQVFPGLSMQKPENYDFSDAKIKFFVLKNDDYRNFLGLLRVESKDPKPDGVKGKIYYRSWVHDEPGRIGKLHLDDFYSKSEIGRSKNNLIVVQELQGPENELKEPDFTKPETLTRFEDRLRQVMRHEVFHALKGGNILFPDQIEEGIVNNFALLARNLNEHCYVPDAYIIEARMVMGVALLCKQSGIQQKVVEQAFIGQDPDSVRLIRAAVEGTMGIDFAHSFFDKGFKDRRILTEELKRLTDQLER